jgi:hypothetical protein
MNRALMTQLPDSNVETQQRIAILLAEADRQRGDLADIIDDYRATTGRIDRLYRRLTGFVRGNPLTSTVTLGVGAFVLLQIRRRLPNLPLRNLVRSGSAAVAVIRLLRRT